MLTTFAVLAQPIRRSILDRLRDGEHLVGELAEALGLPQPLTSKHLGCCATPASWPFEWTGRGAGTACAVEPLAELDNWLAPYRWMWDAHLDRLGAHLDAMPEHEGDTDVR